MDDTVHAALGGRGNLYVIAGGAAAAFGTPTVVHLSLALLLVCVGIHNAWDSVTYMRIIAVKMPQRRAGSRAPADDGMATGDGGEA